jgi:hypothetical protein
MDVANGASEIVMIVRFVAVLSFPFVLASPAIAAAADAEAPAAGGTVTGVPAGTERESVGLGLRAGLLADSLRPYAGSSDRPLLPAIAVAALGGATAVAISIDPVRKSDRPLPWVSLSGCGLWIAGAGASRLVAPEYGETVLASTLYLGASAVFLGFAIHGVDSGVPSTKVWWAASGAAFGAGALRIAGALLEQPPRRSELSSGYAALRTLPAREAASPELLTSLEGKLQRQSGRVSRWLYLPVMGAGVFTLSYGLAARRLTDTDQTALAVGGGMLTLFGLYEYGRATAYSTYQNRLERAGLAFAAAPTPDRGAVAVVAGAF